MPTYEYRCDACSHEFEEFQYIKDEPLKKCPNCGKNKLRRLISGGAAIVFKGSGFYQTDYRSDSYKKSAQSELPAAPATTSACNNCPSASTCKESTSTSASTSVSTSAPASTESLKRKNPK
ncbi:MAG: zinc ribbon domain-containing protein [Planctomycetaceae bacterium]|nr:zinc ribbon domain-containing protein [Planctomycetaceae bacterium]